MSGGKGGGGGGLPDLPIDCARFTKEVVLSSPDPAVIPTLVPGDVLNLEFEPNSDNRVIRAVTDDDRIAGSVTGEPRLRSCMLDGFEYVAEVVSIQGGACRVKIRAA